ncbi:MAG: chemotaxis protein CheW [Cyanobacteria bacterium P01_G01_bin.49]
MAIYSPRLARRLRDKKTEKTQQFVCFLLAQEWFALPIDVIQKVVQLGKVYGDPQGKGISLTNYQGKELLVIDVARRIFGLSAISSSCQDENKLRFLLIIQNKYNETVGLPIDSPPSIRHIPESAFLPLPEIYLTQGNIHCISSTMIEVSNQAPLFVLDVTQLTNNQG